MKTWKFQCGIRYGFESQEEALAFLTALAEREGLAMKTANLESLARTVFFQQAHPKHAGFTSEKTLVERVRREYRK